MKEIPKHTLLILLAIVSFCVISCNQPAIKSAARTDSSEAKFSGEMKLDVRQSTPDWKPFMRKKAPEGAPNVLFILFDDTGLATWSPYGGRVNMPTLDGLAKDGLTYTQWHTVALCSPTRSCILTGRNHNLAGFGSITEGANGYPGFSGHLPEQTATIGQVLQENGWSTFWLGKDHNVPETDLSSGGNKIQ